MRRLAVVIAASTIGLAGCGVQTVTRSSFLARGDAACAAAWDHIRDLALPRAAPSAAPMRFAGYVDDYVAEMRLELIDLQAIGYPPGQRARLAGDYRHLATMLVFAERKPLDFTPRIFDSTALALRDAGLSACRP